MVNLRLLGFFSILLIVKCLGCATVSEGLVEKRETSISSESAVIFWDAKTQTEHFIRTANISSEPGEIGFLVPTPTTPQLTEVDPAIFTMASEVCAPKRVPREKNWNLMTAVLAGIGQNPFLMTLSHNVTDFVSKDPAILAEKDVAGYHATVLEAADVHQLQNWLQENHFVWTDGDAQWLQPYVARHWKITAFLLIKNQKMDAGLSTRALRLSFHTEKPFFPYSEPDHTQQSAELFHRSLEVAILSDQLMGGRLEEGASWPGEPRFLGSSTPDPALAPSWQAGQWLKLANLEGVMDLPKSVSCYRDYSDPRPGNSDLIFQNDPELTPFRKEIIDQNLPVVRVWQFSDIPGFLLIWTVFFAYIYVGIRSIQNNSYLLYKPDLSALPVRSLLIQRLDHFSIFVCYIMGFIQSFVLCLLPLYFVVKANSMVLYEPYLKKEQTSIFHPLEGSEDCMGVASGLVVIVMAIVYLANVYNYVF